jgi:hypothetical protein
MIDEVYGTVLSVLNKNNYGYVTPADFNLFATQAQLSIFEDFFYSYNHQINKENMRQSGIGYADLKSGIEQDIAIFAKTQVLDQPTATANTANIYNLPSDYYFVNKLYFYPTLLYSGTTTAEAAGKLVDTTANQFVVTAPAVPESPPIGSIVINTSPTGAPTAPILTAYVTAVDSVSTLSLSADIMSTGAAPYVGQDYKIYNANNIVDIEKVSQYKIFNLTSSNLTAPTKTYPAYVLSEGVSETATIYPSTINQKGDVVCQYIRYPKTPKWTYNVVSATPLFNPTAVDYQDFEIPEDNMVDLVALILQYSGMSIREVEVYKFGAAQDMNEKQSEQ